MPWGRLDDQLHQNGKVWSFSDKAFRVWIYSISYCNAKRAKDPEGRLSASEAAVICRLANTRITVIDELVEKVGWERVDGGYIVHDFAVYGLAVDLTGARRMALFRNPELTRAVKERDQNRCRYCGVYVRWTDRKSPGGGTFDHVDPAGENEIDNLVVACRGCNSRKRDRTPEEAGMPLRPVPKATANLDSATGPIRSESALPVPVPGPVPHEASTQTGHSLQEATARAPETGAESVRAFAVPKPGQIPEARAQREAVVDWLVGAFHGVSPPNAAERERLHQAAGLFYESHVGTDELPRLFEAARERWSEDAEINPLSVARRVGDLRRPKQAQRRNGKHPPTDPMEQSRRVALSVIADQAAQTPPRRALA